MNPKYRRWFTEPASFLRNRWGRNVFFFFFPDMLRHETPTKSNSKKGPKVGTEMSRRTGGWLLLCNLEAIEAMLGIKKPHIKCPAFVFQKENDNDFCALYIRFTKQSRRSTYCNTAEICTHLRFAWAFVTHLYWRSAREVTRPGIRLTAKRWAQSLMIEICNGMEW